MRATWLLLWLGLTSGGYGSSSPPVILFQPVEQRAVAGGRTEIGVSALDAAGDNAILTYQWLHDGRPVDGAVNRVMSFSPVRPSDSGGWQVIVRGGSGETWSRTAVLHVTAEAPAPGTVDPDFFAAKIENPEGGVRGTVYAIAPAPGGGLLIGGDFTLVGGVSRPGLARLTASGGLDPTFTLTGLPTLPVIRCLVPVAGGWLAGGAAFTVRRPWLAFIPAGGGSVSNLESGWAFAAVSGQEVRAILPLPDGRVLAGGTFSATKAGYTASRLLRLKADRTLDTTLPAGGWNAGVLSLALTPDGSVLAAGSFSIPQRCLARLLPHGAPDATFSMPSTGWSAAAEISAVAVESTGRIIAGGKYSYTPAGSFTRWSLAAFLPDGTPDAAFAAKLNTDGKAEVRALMADGPDRIIIGGRFTELNDVDPQGIAFKVPWSGVARLNAAGRPAPSQRSASWDDRTVWSLAAVSPPAKSPQILAGGDFSWPAARLTALRAGTPASFAPVILSGPSPQSAFVRSGEPLRLTIAASAWPEPALQWFRDGQPIDGATGGDYFIPNAQPVHSGRYTARVTNAAGSVTSAPVTVVVHTAPPGFAPLAAGTSAGALSIQQFTSNQTAVRVTAPFPVTRIAVTLRLTHKDTNDLGATLIAPGGQQARLFRQPDPTGRNFDDTVFDDTSTLQLSDSLPPFRGAYQTGGALNSLRPGATSGDWFLEIENTGGQTAVLESWQLLLEGAASPVTYETWKASALAGVPRSAPDEDADGDGLSNAHEWLFGPVPCDPGIASGGIRSLRLLSDGTAQLLWCGWQSGTYQLEWSPDLRRWLPAIEGQDYFPSWLSLTEPSRCEHTVRLARPAAAAFWRLRGR